MNEQADGFMVGDFVRFLAPGGSVGRVSALSGGIVYVQWHYGLDRLGHPVVAAGSASPSQLEEIPELAFWKVAARDAWDESQALSFESLRARNVARCEESFHSLDRWDLLQWAGAAAGELGEAANVSKKMVRQGPRDMPPGHYLRALAHELADAVIYLDLWAARAGIDLGKAVRAKFNLTSKEVGSKIEL